MTDHSGPLAGEVHDVVIRAPTRVHLGLIAMTLYSTRKYGGLGVALALPDVLVRARCDRGRHVSIHGLDPDRAANLAARLESAGVSGVDVRLVHAPSHHVGLGSGTAVSLAVVEAAALCKGMLLSPQDVVRVSGRGGTSGIGVNTYFTGGVIADAGHKAGGEFGPSSSTTPATAPRLLFRLSWPPEWVIILATLGRVHVSGVEERRFFRSHGYLDRGDASDAAMALLLEVPAAITDHDFGGFREALRASRTAGFKRREIEAQPLARALMERFEDHSGIAATLSSFGPTVFFACSDETARDTLAADLRRDGVTHMAGRAADAGRVVLTSDSAQ